MANKTKITYHHNDHKELRKKGLNTSPVTSEMLQSSINKSIFELVTQGETWISII
jgi:hypothetical protein